MPTFTVDLPAHNIKATFFGSPGVTIVGGVEALADHDPSSYVRFEGSGDESINVGVTGTSDSLGFGVWDQPAGTTVTSIQFVAEGYRDSSLAHGAVTDWDFAIGDENSDAPVVDYPVVLVRYTGDPWPSFGGYNLSTFPLDVVGESIAPGQINLPDFVIAPGPSTGPRAGGLGLSPVVALAVYPFPRETQAVVLTYLAIRITYTGGSFPPRRGWPRHQATTAARGVGGRDDIQTGPRGIGSVV